MKFVKENWFALIVAICTIIVSIAQVVAIFLSQGFFQFIWNWHDGI